MNTQTSPRPIHEIADEIRATWKNPYFGAVPYLDAMLYLEKITDRYIEDPGVNVVSYFLANATTWRGEDARRIKAELNAMVKAAR